MSNCRDFDDGRHKAAPFTVASLRQAWENKNGPRRLAPTAINWPESKPNRQPHKTIGLLWLTSISPTTARGTNPIHHGFSQQSGGIAEREPHQWRCRSGPGDLFFFPQPVISGGDVPRCTHVKDGVCKGETKARVVGRGIEAAGCSRWAGVPDISQTTSTPQIAPDKRGPRHRAGWAVWRVKDTGLGTKTVQQGQDDYRSGSGDPRVSGVSTVEVHRHQVPRARGKAEKIAVVRSLASNLAKAGRRWRPGEEGSQASLAGRQEAGPPESKSRGRQV